MKRVIFSVVLSAIACTSAANAAGIGGSGKVNFSGSIVDAPCSMDPNTADQTVELGATSNLHLSNGSTSTPKPFKILLEGCSGETLGTVMTTFKGLQADEDDTLLRLSGSASGAAISINDDKGVQIKMGEASPAYNLVAGNNELNFSANLKGFGTEEKPVVSGDFTATADFTLEYN
ncbi:type 1 fimbrial protein [Cedecea davisae]|uniref:Type 1 fimbrial protein n=2 Tax=Cedecea davisae TaxID=158484 RepID=A0ABS6DLH6_9ENTR|nr:type 1 fimbrial protein [Cedecea davisae]MBU4689071.1 type 1 fimbrial protein [Cedecea davisae]